MNLFLTFLVIVTFFLLLVKLIGSYIGRVSERLLTGRFRALEALVEHDTIPIEWRRQAEKIKQSRSPRWPFGTQHSPDEAAKSFLLKKIRSLRGYFETSPFVESAETRTLLLEQLDEIAHRWEASNVGDILSNYKTVSTQQLPELVEGKSASTSSAGVDAV